MHDTPNVFLPSKGHFEGQTWRIVSSEILNGLLSWKSKKGFFFAFTLCWASLVAQTVNDVPAMQETWI